VGIGGTNVHVVVQDAPERRARAAAGSRPTVLPLSARTESQLRLLADRLATRLRETDAPPLPDVAHTLRTGRVGMAVRAYVVASDAREAADKLTALAEGHRDTTTDPVGEAWLRGGTVTWPALDGEVRRVRLPAYPFAGERYGALRLRGPVTAAPEAPSPAPENELETQVAGLVVEALDLDGPAGLAQTYFEAGGDSLTAVHLAGRLRDELGIDVPIQLFLEPITLKDMTKRIVEMKQNGDADGALDALLAEFEAEA
jgi:acyl transferase domain-containing protein